MGKRIKFSEINEGQTTKWRLEIQYKSIESIHPSHLSNANGRTPIIFEKESFDLQEIYDTSRRMSTIYSTDEWNHVIAIINSKTSIVN